MGHVERQCQLKEFVGFLLAAVEDVHVFCASRLLNKFNQTIKNSICVGSGLLLESGHSRCHCCAEHTEAHRANIKDIRILIEKALFLVVEKSEGTRMDRERRSL